MLRRKNITITYNSELKNNLSISDLRKIALIRLLSFELGITCQIDNKVQITKDPYELMAKIKFTIHKYFNIEYDRIQDSKRKRELVQCRQIGMYFSKNMTRLSLEDIGFFFGKKDHATVLHACKTVNNLIETDQNYKYQIEDIKKQLTKLQ